MTPSQAAIASRCGHVVVLYGGQSAEREVSLNGGRAVLAGLQHCGVNATGLEADRHWLERLMALQADRVFIMVHGAGGEDGVMQGALETVGIPYTGSGVLASALAMDKIRCKQFWQGVGLATPSFARLNRHCKWDAVLADLGGSAMVKPAREGSSLGMSRADTAAELEASWRAARQFDPCVLAEQWLAGAEYTVAIVNDRALPAIKLETDRAFYDYEAKYLADDTRYVCPCGLAPEAEQMLQALALSAYRSLGCHGWGRVDIMANAADELFVLEVNTVPGMTDHSLVPMAAKAAGMDFGDLLLEIVEASLQPGVNPA